MTAPSQPGRGVPRRRSYRFSHRVPVVLTSRDPETHFYEQCETTDVSSHGCCVHSQRKLTPGQRVRLQIPSTAREAEARVARVVPDPTATLWEIGLELAEPGNIWDLEFSPHTLHWPADLALPPVQTEPATPRPAEPAAAVKKEPFRVPEPPPPPVLEKPVAFEEVRRRQEHVAKEFETRIEQALRDATSQLTKNTQFALETAEASIRELGEAARRELQDWREQQQKEMEGFIQRMAHSARVVAVEEAVDHLREQMQVAVQKAMEDFRGRLHDALQASLQTLADRLGKGKLS